MKKILEKLLAWKTSLILAKYKPTLLAIAGSYGKTGTRHAVAAVLRGKFNVRTALLRDYNTEFGLPLIVIGADDPGKSFFGWLKVLLQADKIILFGVNNFPQIFVLEYGIEYPGDMEKLCKIAAPDVIVFTGISPVHVENFGSLEKLIAEKATIFDYLKKDGLAVFNADDPEAMKLKEKTSAKSLSYGFGTADVRASNVAMRTRDDFSFEPGEQFSSLTYDITYEKETVNAERINVLGVGAISSSLAAAAVASHFDISLAAAVDRFSEIMTPPGRMKPIAGIKGALILDDSYNAAPKAMDSALDVLASFSPHENARRIAVLGKMAQLGELTEEEHRKIGKKVALLRIDLLVTIEDPAKFIAEEAIQNGFPIERVKHFDSSAEAGRWLDNEVKIGDIVLVKGSQSARTEKVVKDLMAEPLLADKLLVRQYGKWLKE